LFTRIPQVFKILRCVGGDDLFSDEVFVFSLAAFNGQSEKMARLIIILMIPIQRDDRLRFFSSTINLISLKNVRRLQLGV
jgi:hypothetical protein